MRKKLLLLALVLSVVVTTAPAWSDGDFYVIAGGGPSGKVLKTQVFTYKWLDNTLGGNYFAKLSNPQWIYTKLSATSYLVITYQDGISCTGGGDNSSFYQLRVNDQPSVAGAAAAILLVTGNNWNMTGATGVWFGLPKGDANLSIWHSQYLCASCTRGRGNWTTSVVVMEIEP